MENNINKIRLIYAKASKHDNIYTGEKKFEVRLDIHKSLNIPAGISLDDAFALASYLSLKVERENNLEECDPRGVALVSEKLKNYGFTENEDQNIGYHHSTYEYRPFAKYVLSKICPRIDGCLDLFVVDGDIECFEKTSLNDRYVEWFTPSIKEKDISKISSKKR